MVLSLMPKRPFCPVPVPAPALLFWALAALIPPPRPVVDRVVYLMGTTLRAQAAADTEAQAQAALEAALEDMERVAALLTTWDPASPMSALNRAPVGAPTPVPSPLADLLDEADVWARATGRAFDPTVGALVDAWDLRGAGRLPDADALAAALAAVGPEAISVGTGAATLTRHHPAAWIDTGAFGKGAALREAARTLRAAGIPSALLDLGGQLLAVNSPGNAPLAVAVAHPADRQRPAAWLRLSNASAATSGNSERGLVVDGVRVGHLLDPRTGRPAPDWGSVTVVSTDPLVADILSTALYVMGPDDGLAWALRRDDVGVLFLVMRDGKLEPLHNQAMERWLAQPPASAGTTHTPSPERRLP